ncbi:hypothetical protein OnM2_032057 [Erysiphe neolycopersici]|uniref:Uncharacterized protein n=1 Tax=Erysiphe neolycopersici TaxID=212602 RepID=A0A420HYY7_9PEZI|nr:hypothetical protein OnM2_032057 [Erysiphe neolycopersici]
MAVVTAPQALSALPNSQNSNVDTASWNLLVSAQSEKTIQSQSPESHPNKTYNDTLTHRITAPNVFLQHQDTHNSMRSSENALSPSTRTIAPIRKNSSISDTGSAADSLLDLYGPNQSSVNSMDSQQQFAFSGLALKDDEVPESSRWIHRDKLAQIESQELQAAGIAINQPRASGKAQNRRGDSKDLQINNNTRIDASQKRQWIDPMPTEEEEAPENSSWDLRLPEEVAAEDGFTDIGNGVKSISKIPVCKKSPFPIPTVHLERDTILPRKKSGLQIGEEEVLSTTKMREQSNITKEPAITINPGSKRVASESFIVKKSDLRSRSVSVSRETTNRPSTRSGPNIHTISSRATENGYASTKRPEGDPPWLSSMYKPDPRLPPEQQLLPTIAKRLQQEKWEREGKFGNIYDTSFRPLNDQSPAIRSVSSPMQITVPKDQSHEEWPLQSPKSASLSTGRPGTAGGYSTMPRIIDPPSNVIPLPTPKHPAKETQPPKVEKKEKCGCCILM